MFNNILLEGILKRASIFDVSKFNQHKQFFIVRTGIHAKKKRNCPKIDHFLKKSKNNWCLQSEIIISYTLKLLLSFLLILCLLFYLFQILEQILFRKYAPTNFFFYKSFKIYARINNSEMQNKMLIDHYSIFLCSYLSYFPQIYKLAYIWHDISDYFSSSLWFVTTTTVVLVVCFKGV